MTQPAVSRAIRELEDYYHFQLFERVKQRLVLTDGGKMVYHRAVHLINEFDLLEKDMLAYHEQHTLAIGANYTMAERVLPALIYRLSKEDPLLRFAIHVEPTEKLLHLMENNSLDIALMGSAPPNDDLIFRHLSSDRFVSVLPVGHPLTEKQEVTLAELLHYPFFAR